MHSNMRIKTVQIFKKLTVSIQKVDIYEVKVKREQNQQQRQQLHVTYNSYITYYNTTQTVNIL